MTSKLLIYSTTLSTCCRSRQLIVLSREGGFVTQNCTSCGNARRVREAQLPDLYCVPCGCQMAPFQGDDKCFWYSCSRCNTDYRLPDLVPWWYEYFRYCGVATPNER